MPENLIGAFVDCFAAAPDYESALRLAVQKLTSDGQVFDDIKDGKVDQLDPDKCDDHIASTWPDHRDYFPPQSDMVRFIDAGGVFFGPFIAWETELARQRHTMCDR